MGAEAQAGALQAGAQLAGAQEWGTGSEATPPLPTPTRQTQVLECRGPGVTAEPWEEAGRLTGPGAAAEASPAVDQPAVGAPAGRLPSPARDRQMWGQSPAQELGSLKGGRGEGGLRGGVSRTRPGTTARQQGWRHVPPMSVHPPRCRSQGPSRAPLFCDGTRLRATQGQILGVSTVPGGPGCCLPHRTVATARQAHVGT